MRIRILRWFFIALTGLLFSGPTPAAERDPNLSRRVQTDRDFEPFLKDEIQKGMDVRELALKPDDLSEGLTETDEETDAFFPVHYRPFMDGGRKATGGSMKKGGWIWV
jgi:hypothetical protein